MTNRQAIIYLIKSFNMKKLKNKNKKVPSRKSDINFDELMEALQRIKKIIEEKDEGSA